LRANVVGGSGASSLGRHRPKMMKRGFDCFIHRSRLYHQSISVSESEIYCESKRRYITRSCMSDTMKTKTISAESTIRQFLIAKLKTFQQIIRHIPPHSSMHAVTGHFTLRMHASMSFWAYQGFVRISLYWLEVCSLLGEFGVLC